MSTFTDWNGPQGTIPNGIRNSDLLALTKAYNEVLNALNNKQDKLVIDETLSVLSDNVVKNKTIASAIDTLKNTLDSVNKLLDAEVAERKKNDEETEAQLDKVSNELGDSFVKLSTELKQQLKESQDTLDTIAAAFDVDEDSVTVLKALKVTSYLLESPYIDFRKLIAFKAPTVTVEGEQPAFILGMMSAEWEPSNILEKVADDFKTKAGRAFIKFLNSKSFDAVVDMSASNDGEGKWSGALSVTGSNVSAIKELRLRLVSGTDLAGNKHVWLAILSGNWTAATPDFATELFFYATGINFYPVSSDGYKAPNDIVQLIAETSLGNGFSTSAFSAGKVTDSNGNELFEIKQVGNSKRLLIGNDLLKGIVFYARPYYKTSPILSLDDMKAVISEVGTVVAWSKFDEDGNCVEYPDNYLPCDGGEFTEEDYPELYALLEGKLPVVDFHLIKAKYGKDLHELPETSGQSLEYVIASLHGISVYTRLEDVPSEWHIGKPVIIRDNDPVTGDYEYFVMVKTAEGWTEYGTEFDDYEKTIESIASVIASLHGSDVYTLYDNADNLPNSAEDNELAIVISNNKVDTYKFVNNQWELQA